MVGLCVHEPRLYYDHLLQI